MNQCVKCGKPIQTTATTGRPPDYCSASCRRAAEYEVRRVNRRIEMLEERLAWEKLTNENTRDASGRKRAERVDSLNGLIAEAEGRLKRLLSAKGD